MSRGMIIGLLKAASAIYPVRLVYLIKELNDRLFSFAISKKFAETGHLFRVASDSLIIGPERISIGNKFQAFSRLRLEAITKYGENKFSPVILIGNNVSINFDCHIGAINRIEIGDNVLIGSRVTLVDHSHGLFDESTYKTAPSTRALYSKGPLCIGKNAWIGEGVTILGGVNIGENVIVGANSLVNRSFPSNVIVAGVPAKIIKTIFPND